jgi:hypothetical protein
MQRRFSFQTVGSLHFVHNTEEITEELGFRQLSVKNSDTEFHDNMPNTLAADTRSVTDVRKCSPEKVFQFVTSSRKLTMSAESNHT